MISTGTRTPRTTEFPYSYFHRDKRRPDSASKPIPKPVAQPIPEARIRVIHCPRCGGRLFIESDSSSGDNSYYWGCISCGREYTHPDLIPTSYNVVHRDPADGKTKTVSVSYPRLPILSEIQ